jgi:hypothetical protein
MVMELQTVMMVARKTLTRHNPEYADAANLIPIQIMME